MSDNKSSKHILTIEMMKYEIIKLNGNKLLQKNLKIRE